MRVALDAAVRQLLNDPRLGDPRLKGCREAVRLAVVILLCKAPANSATIEMQSRDFAGWLGCSLSYFAHTVRYWLEETGLATITQVHDGFGYVDRLRFELTPLREARTAGPANPLAALGKRELGVLLATAEAVTCPGWPAPRNKPEAAPTPPGFMDFEKKKKGSASIRLAVLLLVLRCRMDGKVPMVAGKVKAGFSRSDATLAKIMGWSLTAAARAVERMNRDGVLLLAQGAKGDHQGRMHIAAVSAAHARFRLSDVITEPAQPAPARQPEQGPTVCAACAEQAKSDDEFLLQGDGWAQATFDDALGAESSTAFRDQEPLMLPETLGAAGIDDVSGTPASADIHANHTPVVALSNFAAGALHGFSGSAGGGEGTLREGACPREDQDLRSVVPKTPEPPTRAGVGPLRRENPKKTMVDERVAQRAARTESGGSLKGVGWYKAQQPRRVDLPADFRLRVALEPVSMLWERLNRWQQDQVEAAAKTELVLLEGLLTQPGGAPRLLARRLADRLQEIGGEALVSSPYGWLIRRGLVQRPSCSDRRCDDGIRLDTSGGCETCHNVIHHRRARRTATAAQIARDLPHLSSAERQQAVEKQLRAQTAATAESLARRRKHIAHERQERTVNLAAIRERRTREKQAAAVEAAARRAEPCRTCGTPDASGHCDACAARDSTYRLLQDAVDLAVAARCDLTEPSAAFGLLEQCQSDTQKLITKHCGQDADAQTKVQVARRIRIERRESALRRLAECKEVATAGDTAYIKHRKRFPSAPKRDAQQAAQRAEQQAAETMLNQRLNQLVALRSSSDWAGKLLVQACDMKVSGDGAMSPG